MTDSVLTAAPADWQPGPVETARWVEEWPAQAFAALLGAPAPALEPPRVHAPRTPVTEFAYRLVQPVFVPSRIEATATLDGAQADLTVGAVGVGASRTATATPGRSVLGAAR